MDQMLQDTLSLRRSMFICHNEREEYLDQMKMKKMRWDMIGGGVMNNLEPDPGYQSISISDSAASLTPALRNVDILENIATSLSMEDLLNCRLVCKHWSIEMTSFLFKRKSLIVTSENCHENAATLLRKRSEGHPISLSKLSLFSVDAAGTLYRQLFSVFGLTLSNVSLEDCNLSPRDFSRMFLVDAPNIVNLHLREGGENRSKQKISTFKSINSYNNSQLLLPKLKVLHWDEENGRTDLKDLVEACPNLVVLEIRNFPVPRSNQFKKLRWKSLTDLFLSPHRDLTDEHCKALAHLKLPLKKLTLFGVNACNRSSMKSLNKFLSSLASTLEALELWLDYGYILGHPRPVTFSPFPVYLPKVRKLLTESDLIGHINHLGKFPSLTELNLISNIFEGQNWPDLTKRATIQKQSKLQSLHCGDIDSKSLNKVLRALPCITRINIYATHVDDMFMRSVIKNLTHLEEFTISPCMRSNGLRLSDSAVTGIPAEFCKKFNQNPKQFGTVDIESVKTKPGIGDLKLLKTLDLCLQDSDLSDASVILAICNLTNLTLLKLPQCKITDVSLAAIEERLTKLVVFRIAGCRNVSQEAIKNFERRRSGLFLDKELPPTFEDMM